MPGEAAMNLSVNGHSQVPPGFRFHPTEEELLHYYLRKKVASEKIDLDVIRDVDLNKLEPWDIQERCRIGSTPQNDWYFFSHKDKKYPTGTRTNRATTAGFWKATGRDKIIYSSLRRIGMRKTLVFYRGRAPHGQKSDWIMHEYRLDDNNTIIDSSNGSNIVDFGPEEGWVVCRVFKKKNYHKALDGPLMMTTPSNSTPRNDDAVIGQILTYMGRSSCSSNCKQENKEPIIMNRPDSSFQFSHLPELMECHQGVTNPSSSSYNNISSALDYKVDTNSYNIQGDWVALDRLVASQLNGGLQYDGQYASMSDEFGAGNFAFEHHDQETTELVNLHNLEKENMELVGDMQDDHDDTDFWTFARSSSLITSSSSDPLCHLSV